MAEQKKIDDLPAKPVEGDKASDVKGGRSRALGKKGGIGGTGGRKGKARGFPSRRNK